MKQVNLRLPDDLHARVKQAAQQDRRSLNGEILWLLDRALDARTDDALGRTSSPS